MAVTRKIKRSEKMLKTLSGDSLAGSWCASFLNGYIVRAFIQFMREICRDSFPITASPEGLRIQVKCESGLRCLIDVIIPRRCLKYYYYIAPVESFGISVNSEMFWPDAKGLARQVPATLTKVGSTSNLSFTMAENIHDTVMKRVYQVSDTEIDFPTLSVTEDQAIILSLKELSKTVSALKQRSLSSCNYTMTVYQTCIVLSSSGPGTGENCRGVIGNLNMPIEWMTGQEVTEVLDQIAEGTLISNIPETHPDFYRQYLKIKNGEEVEAHALQSAAIPPEDQEEEEEAEEEEEGINDMGSCQSSFVTTQDLIAKVSLDTKLVKAISKLTPCDSAVVRVMAEKGKPVNMVMEVENLGTISIFLDEQTK